MAKPKHKEIIEHFIQTFLAEETMTSSEYRMLSIKLSNLKKVVKEYIITNNIDTEKPVEQIIWECIDYCAMTGKKFKSIASLGYSDLPKSIEYWKKREEVLKAKEEEAKKKERESDEEAKLKQLQDEANKRRSEQRRTPKWMLEDD